MTDGSPPDVRAARWFQLGVYCELGLFLVALAIAWVAGLNPAAWVRGAGIGDMILGMVATLPLLGLFYLVLRLDWKPFARIRTIMEANFLPIARCWSMGRIAIVSLLAGVCEEVMFRGVLPDVLGQWVSPAAALVVGSVVFGLCHAITPAYAVLATGIGAVFGVMSLFTGNLVAAVTAHALYDFVALLWWTRVKPGSAR